jgi:hypothetical protein
MTGGGCTRNVGKGGAGYRYLRAACFLSLSSLALSSCSLASASWCSKIKIKKGFRSQYAILAYKGSIIPAFDGRIPVKLFNEQAGERASHSSPLSTLPKYGR